MYTIDPKRTIPCPFCGTNQCTALIDNKVWKVQCLNCAAEGPSMGSEDSAIKQWNYRPKLDTKKRCPRCGDTKYSSTYIGYIGRDENDVRCDCGWLGKAYELK